MKKTWMQMLVIFALGAVVGFAAACGAGRHLLRPWGKGKHFQEHMLKQFNKKLQLTSEQSTQVAAILESKRQKIDALRSEMQPKFQELRNATRAEIRQLLTPDQQKKFDVMDAAFEAKAKRFRNRWEEKKQ